MDKVGVRKVILHLGKAVRTPPKILHYLGILKSMNHRPGDHDIINVMHVTVKFRIERSLPRLTLGIDVRPEVLDVEGAEPTIEQVHQGVPVDVEDLGGMAGGVDSFVVAPIDAATKPENLVGPTTAGVQGVEPIRPDWEAVGLHVKGVLGGVLKLYFVKDELFNHQPGSPIISIRRPAQVCMLKFVTCKAARHLSRHGSHK